MSCHVTCPPIQVLQTKTGLAWPARGAARQLPCRHPGEHLLDLPTFLRYVASEHSPREARRWSSFSCSRGMIRQSKTA
jgi:hypothetical protein